MPAKKKAVAKPAAAKAEKAVKPVKKAAEKKPEEEKKAPAKKAAEKPVEAKKASAKKAAVKSTASKSAEKKTSAKKTAAAKKAVVKAEAAKEAAVETKPVEKKEEKKPAVEKKSFQTYKDVINWKKWEAHNMNWLYIEVNAGDLMTELEAGVNNIETCANAILDCMLEGDGFINDPKNRISTDLTVRYYCDNLSEDRRKYFDVNK